MTRSLAMRPLTAVSLLAKMSAILLLLGSMASAGCGSDEASVPRIAPGVETSRPEQHDAGRPKADEIVYVEATWLPEGWTVGHATERVGPPADYTLVWRPAAGAGASRSDSTGNDSGSRIWANVGAAAYHGPQTYSVLKTLDLEGVDVAVEDGYLSLDFHLGCCVVALGGEGVEAGMLTRMAEGLRGAPRDDWTTGLGDRLLIDRG